MLILILVAFVFLIFLVLVFEFILRHFFPQNVNRIHVNGKKLTMHDEIVGFVCNPGAHVRTNGPEFSAEYKINEAGLRDEFKYENSRAAIRILIIGDSFAFGAANNYDQIWPVIFERKLKQYGYDVEVIKAGIPFRNTDGDVLYLENILPKYTPDFVIYNFLPNNLFVNRPLVNDGNSLKLKKRSDEDIIGMNNKIGSLHIITFLRRVLISNDFLYAFIYMHTSRGQFFKVPQNNKVKHQIKVTKNLLSRMVEFCRNNHTRFLVLSLPQQFQVLLNARQYKILGADVSFIDNTFSQFAYEKEFAWIQTLPKLADTYHSTGRDCYFRLDGHLNNEGNLLIGEYLADEFIRIALTERHDKLNHCKDRYAKQCL